MSRIEDLVASIHKRNPLKDPTTESFERSGEATATTLIAEITQVFGENPELSILDFGAAAGRVAQPLARRFPRAEVVATDVDEEAIEYLSMLGKPNIRCVVNGFQPPLDFDEDTFDTMYALSVWSHISEADGTSWLSELHRVGKPGAIVAISTNGLATLAKFRENTDLWKDVQDADLVNDGIIYKEFRGLAQATEAFPGIAGEGSWGDAFIHPDYIRRSWSSQFDAIDVREGATGGTQDLVVMRVR